MARKREDNAVVAPLIGSGILGGGAYGSHRLNRFMEDLGISSKFELNPEALKAIDDYTGLVPNPNNPSSFAYQYAQAANRAGGTQLFLGDPKKRKAWEWDINNPELRARINEKFPELSKRLSSIEHALVRKEHSFLRKLPGHKWIVDNLKAVRRGIRDAKNTMSPLDEFVKKQMFWHPELKSDKPIAVALAHVPEMGRSPVESYVRLLDEVAPHVNPRDFADNTVEAILNYKNPTYKDYAGKVFESPGDYLNEMWTPKGHKKYKGVFDDYLNHVKGLEEGKAFFASPNPSKDVTDLFRHDIALKLTRESKKPVLDSTGKLIGYTPTGDMIQSEWDVVNPITKEKIIGPDGKPKHVIQRVNMKAELSKAIGRRAQWGFELGENGARTGIKIVKPGGLVKGIRSVQDIWDLSHGHLGLKALNAIATAKYTEAARPYKLMTDIIRKAQFLRNGKLRAGLALGSLALGGMGAANIYRNHKAKKENRRLINRIKNWIEYQIDKI